MDRKLIFLDIDGTLVCAMQAPSEYVKQAVRGQMDIKYFCVRDAICRLSEMRF